jgi:hypothetical protein
MTCKAAKVTIRPSNNRNSEVQMSLNYAKQVATQVTERRRAELQRKRAALVTMVLECRADLELRDQLIRQCDAELKRLDSDE